jgi:hypothetical protein
MFGSLMAVPESFRTVGNIVDVCDEHGGIQSYRFDGNKWVEYLRPDRPKRKSWFHRH